MLLYLGWKEISYQHNNIGIVIAEKLFKQDILTPTQQNDALCMVCCDIDLYLGLHCDIKWLLSIRNTPSSSSVYMNIKISHGKLHQPMYPQSLYLLVWINLKYMEHFTCSFIARWSCYRIALCSFKSTWSRWRGVFSGCSHGLFYCDTLCIIMTEFCTVAALLLQLVVSMTLMIFGIV